LHDRFITDNRDDPFNHPIKYDNLIFNSRDFFRHLRCEFRPRKHFRNWLTHFPLRLVDHVIALSEFERDLFIKLGVPAENVTAIPFAVDLDLIDATLRDQRLLQDFVYPRPRILFIGQLKFRKGFDLLIRAAPKVRTVFPTASFIFLTHNLSQHDAFMRIVDEVGAREYVFLVQQRGRADTEPEKMRQYAASDVFVFPTRYEGFGIPLLEAMACRVPIVTTNIPVIDEIIKDGQTGVLTKLNDPDDLAQKILLVLRNDELRHRIVDNGRRRVESLYTDELLGERTEQVYLQTIRGMSDGAP
jgi:glycosyltransferase involved in cell wall biosynthesis